jgi:hypothetical protein
MKSASPTQRARRKNCPDRLVFVDNRYLEVMMMLTHPTRPWFLLLVLISGLAMALTAAHAQVTNDPGSDENNERKIEEASIPTKLSLIPLDDSLYQAEQHHQPLRPLDHVAA